MKRSVLIAAGVLVLSLVLFACGGGAATPTSTPRPTPTPTPKATPTPTKPISGDPVTRGAEIFKSGTSPSCSSCHAVKGVSTANIGPDLTTIGTVGGTRKPGMAAEAYIRESLQSPSTFIVPGQAPIMPPDIAKTLSQADLDDMVAYLLSLK